MSLHENRSRISRKCRTGLAWRLIFVARKGVLIFDFAGDHDKVQNHLRNKA
jgi:hypothetical protein